MTIPKPEPSSLARLVAQDCGVQFEYAESPLMTLTFDNGAQGKRVDLRPTLPLILAC